MTDGTTGVSGVELYVYWRVALARKNAAIAAATAVQALVKQRHPALQTRLLLKQDAQQNAQQNENTAQTETVTVMEIYQHTQSVTPVMQADIKNLWLHVGLENGLSDIERHTEIFSGV